MATRCIVEVGPWGGNGGVPYRFFQENGTINMIYIVSGVCIESLWVGYKDDQGSPTTHGGKEYTIINFDEDEELNKIKGTIGEYRGITVVMSLTFVTNKMTYGPFGTNGGTDFSVPVVLGKFVGFFGGAGDFLDSIGCILQP